jgi:hypothetical protein
MGYLICTFLLVAFFVKAMGKRKLWVAITMALVSTVVSYLLFDTLLKTTLPVGILSGLLRG